MRGKPLELEMMNEQVVYDQLPKRRDAIWSLLLASGYLKVLKQEFDERTGRRYSRLRRKDMRPLWL